MRRDKTITEKLESFIGKLELLESDISTGRLLHFSTLKTAPGISELMVDFIQLLWANFTSRFEDYSIPKDIAFYYSPPSLCYLLLLYVTLSQSDRETSPHWQKK